MANKVANVISLTTDKRIELTEGIFIQHPRFKQIRNRIIYCHNFSKKSAEPECLFIKGLSGTGKTTLCEFYESEFPKIETKEGTIVTVLYASISSAATEKTLASDLLESIGDPAYDKGTGDSMTKRLRKLMKECKVEIVIVDEFQHLIDRDSDTILMNSANWIKDLINKTRVPVVLVGMPWSDRILKSNTQLRRRFSTSETLEPFRWKPDIERNKLKTFLKLVEEMLPLGERSHLSSDDKALRIFCACNGIIGIMMKVIRRAAEIAIEFNSEIITDDLLAQAYDEEIADIDTINGNPFTRDIDKLAIPEPPEDIEWKAFLARKKDRARRPKASEVLRT